MLRRVLIICVGLVCGIFASQGPEFSQQFLQRLGGWVDSHQNLVARLDARAKQSDRTREQYIEELLTHPDPKVRKEAASIATWPIYLKRFTEMQQILQNGPSWMRPIRLLLSYYDPAFNPIIIATFDDYKLGIPITAEGVVYGGAGFIGGWLLAAMGITLLGAPVNIIRRRRERPKKIPTLVAHKLDEPVKTDQA